MNKKPGIFALSVVCILLGLVVTLQLKSITKINLRNDSQLLRAEQLQIELKSEQEKNEALYEQLIRYKDEIDSYRNSATQTDGYAKVIAQSLINAELLAGITDVRGQGVVVTMKDSANINTGGLSDSYFVIHDEDIQKVINELRSAGAEAISLNGERVVSTTAIRCVGSVVSVNDTKYSAPYVIRAIGNAETIENALLMRQGVVDVLTQWGIEIDIKKEADMIIHGYSGATSPVYAQPVKK